MARALENCIKVPENEVECVGEGLGSVASEASSCRAGDERLDDGDDAATPEIAEEELESDEEFKTLDAAFDEFEKSVSNPRDSSAVVSCSIYFQDWQAHYL